MKEQVLVHQCDLCGANMASKKPPAYEVKVGAPGYRQMGERYDLCSECKGKLDLFLEGKLFKHAYREFTLPCPHHVPCAYPCQGVAYKSAW